MEQAGTLAGNSASLKLFCSNKEATFWLEKAIFGFVGPGLSRTDNYLLTDPLIIDLVWDTPDRPDSRLTTPRANTPLFVKSQLPTKLIMKTLLY